MKIVGIALSAIVCATSSAVLAQGIKPSPSTPVQVMNDGSSPVPVTVPGGVSISGNVTVGNTTTNPVPVVGIVSTVNPDGAATIYRAQCLQLLYGESRGSCDLTQVPDGYRLVVETVSAQIGVPENSPGVVPGYVLLGAKPSYADVGTDVNKPSYALPTTPQGKSAQQLWYLFGQSLKVYYEAGEVPRLYASFTAAPAVSGYSHTIAASLSGQLVKLP